jgi:hypothetical protein
MFIIVGGLVRTGALKLVAQLVFRHLTLHPQIEPVGAPMRL